MRNTMRLNKRELVAQSQILTSEFSELLGLYFVCEKIAKKIAPNSNSTDFTLRLGSLVKALNEANIEINNYKLNLIFNTQWKNKTKEQVSFRYIRNKICHDCSISLRDYAVSHKEEYKEAMKHFIDECCKRFG